MSLNISYEISALDDFSQTFSRFENGLRGLDRASGSFKAVGAGMTAVGVGLAAGIGAAIQVGSEFDAQMAKVKAISGATAEEFDAMRKQALALGASTSKSASEVATGFEEMAAMGFEANEVMSAMPGIIAASEASGADMAQVAGVMASTLNSFSMEASEAGRVADILAKTANISAADITDMQYALKYAAPSANALGVSLEELAAATGIMTNAGMEGEQAGTTLRMSFLRLVDPPKEAAAAMDALGFSAIDSQGNFKSMSAIITELGSGMAGMTEAQKLATLSTIFGTEAASGMLNVISAGPAEFDKMTAALQNSAGSSAEAAAIMKDNFKGAMEQLGGAVETLAIGISDVLTPAIRWVTEKITAAIEWFNGLSDGMKQTLVIVGVITTGFLLLAGPLVMLIGFLPQIIMGFTTLAPVLAALTGPIGWIIAGVVALIAIFVALWKNNEAFRDGVIAIWERISAAFNVALTWIKDIVSTVMAEVTAFFGSQLAEIKAFWDENGAAIMKLVKTAFGFIAGIIEIQLGIIKGVFQAVWPIIQSVVKVAWELIKYVISTSLDVILGVVNVFSKLLTGDWEGAWEAVKDIGENIVNNIVTFFKGVDLREIGKNIIQGLLDGISSMASAVMDKARSIADGVKNTISKALGIHSPSRVLMEIGAFTGEGFAMGITDAARQVTAATNAMAGAAIPAMNGSISAARTSAAESRAVASAGPTFIINAQYVDREALQRFAGEVSRIQGRAVGGVR